MNLFKSKGAGDSRSEVFVELCVDDLVKESFTWQPSSNQDTGSALPLPNVIHLTPKSPNLH